MTALTAFVSGVQAADYAPVSPYGDWAFRLEGGAGYTSVTFKPEGEPDESFDGGIANTALSAAFRSDQFFVQLDGTFGFSKEEAFVKQGVFGALLGWRDPDQGMLAAHVSAIGDSGVGTAFEMGNFWRVGGVGELFLDRFSIGAAGGVVGTFDSLHLQRKIHSCGWENMVQWWPMEERPPDRWSGGLYSKLVRSRYPVISDGILHISCSRHNYRRHSPICGHRRCVLDGRSDCRDRSGAHAAVVAV